MLCFAWRWPGEHDLSLAEVRKAVEINPNDAWSLATLGNALDLAGRPHEALPCLERAMVLMPRGPNLKFFLAVGSRVCLNKRDYAAAESWSRRSIEIDPSVARPHLMLAAALAYLGRIKEARAAFEACEHAQPGFAATWAGWREYRNPADNDHIVDGLRKAGMKPR